ncbi:transposase [Burkholderia sp. IT-111MI5]
MDGRTAGLLRRGILSSMGNDGYLAKGQRFLSVYDLRQFDAYCAAAK